MKSTVTSILCVLVLFSSCRRDRHDVITVPQPILSIKLSAPYLAQAQVDSAFAIWNVNNHQQRIRLTISHDSLIAPMNLFEEGNGKMTLHIFSNKKYSNQYYGQWVSRNMITLKKTTALSYNGPASFNDAAWLPRVELKDAIGHKAIVGLRPDDAFFVVKDPGHAITRLTVDRGYWKTVGGIAMAGRGIWECRANCTDAVNEDYFSFLPGMIGTRPWNHISIAILFEVNDNGEGWMVSLEHEP
jgi:hypothetical protein